MIKVNLLNSVTERSSSAAVGVLLGLGMVFDYYSAAASQRKAQAELEKQEQIAQQMAAVNKEQADLEKKLKDIQSRIEVIKKLRTSQQGPVSLLSDINSRLPADAEFRLETIEQKNGELTIEGQSPNEYAVTQFARSLEFSDGLFLNVSLEAARKEVDIKQADYNPADGAVDLSVKPEVFWFTIKCKYGPSAATPAPQDPKKGAQK